MAVHRIPTDAEPIRPSPNRTFFQIELPADEKIKGNGRESFVEPSTSIWTVPIVIVKKLESNVQGCVKF